MHGDEANEASHLRLGRELKSPHAIVIKGAGADADANANAVWSQEKSYFALSADLDSVRAIGRCYRQDAVVWVARDAMPQLILLH